MVGLISFFRQFKLILHYVQCLFYVPSVEPEKEKGPEKSSDVEDGEVSDSDSEIGEFLKWNENNDEIF